MKGTGKRTLKICLKNFSNKYRRIRMIKIALFQADETLEHNVKKLGLDHEVIGRYEDKKICEADFDYVLIPYSDFRGTRSRLVDEYGIDASKIYTFEEYWVRGCEKSITSNYYDRWSKIRDSKSGLLIGKKAVILGGNSGIGKDTARCFLCNGASVCITGRNKEKLESTCSEYSSLGDITYQVWDAVVFEKYKDNLADILKKIGDIDVVVNSIGILDGTGLSYWEVTEEDFDAVIQTNLKSLFFIDRIFARYFVEKRIHGHICNVLSYLGTVPTVKPYGISKWGGVGLTKGMGENLAEYGITVNGVAPGEVATPISHWKEGNCPARRAEKTGRVAFPCEVAETILQLSSYTGDNIIGDVVMCNSGCTSIGIRL